jgi:hypothetical protein
MTFECKYSDAEIAEFLDEYQAGADRKALCARLGISVRTLFRWQAKAGRNRPTLLQMVSSLYEENDRLRRLVDEQGDGSDAAFLRQP